VDESLIFFSTVAEFINVLLTAFTSVEPKSVKKSVSLFTLLGSMSVKAERKYVGEIEPVLLTLKTID